MSDARRSESDTWLLQQQTRAELEADAWRQIRVLRTLPIAPGPATRPANDYHHSGSTLLKAIVRSALGVFGAYLGWIAAMDSRLGEFEIWLSVGAGFIIMLALSLIGPARHLVHMMAETTRWAIITGVGLAALWFLLNPPV